MQSTLITPDEGPAVQVPVMVAADLQDCLLMAAHDLHRLEGLLDHATDNLLARFGEANAVLTAARVAGCAELLALRTALRSAVTELQFHDMATQLIWHTSQVLQGCAFRLSAETMERDEDELDVASRTIIWSLIEQLRVSLIPLFHGLHRCFAVQC